MNRTTTACVFSVVLAGLGVAHAQPQPQPQPPTDAALAAKLASAAELADQNRRSNALNVEVNRKNREVQARNDAKRAAYEKAVADHQAQLAAQAAVNAKAKADYDKAVEAWKADVAACKAGDAKRCATQPAAAKAAQP